MPGIQVCAIPRQEQRFSILGAYCEINPVQGMCLQCWKVTVVSHHNRVKVSSSTRMVTYCEINPDLEVFPIYWSRKEIKEFHRVAVTRIRLSSHRLAIEKGRWSWLPHEERKCTCGEIQTERHIVNECERARDVRMMYDGVKIPVTFS